MKTGNLTVELTSGDGSPTGEMMLSFAGRIDERTTLDALLEDLPNRVVIDLGELRSVSSFGVRIWRQFLASLEERKCRVRVTRCSVPMVQQMNLIPEARAPVDSFFASYECEACEEGLCCS